MFEVVGVMPDEAVFPERAEVWIPRELFGRNESRDGLNERVIARLGAERHDCAGAAGTVGDRGADSDASIRRTTPRSTRA